MLGLSCDLYINFTGHRAWEGYCLVGFEKKLIIIVEAIGSIAALRVTIVIINQATLS